MNAKVTVFKHNDFYDKKDIIASEEILEIEIEQHQKSRSIFIMCSLDDDIKHLVFGFLFNEGIITCPADITHYHYKNRKAHLILDDHIDFSDDHLKRIGFINSSCGACGKNDLNDTTPHQPKPPANSFYIEDILALIPQFNTLQASFKDSGGTHACAIFADNFALLKEDIGRHNALDKLIGELFLKDLLPLPKAILFLSGRISYELVQKATKAQLSFIVAFGAPSSLALKLAIENDICIIGFAKENSCNIYTCKHLISNKNLISRKD